MTGNPALNESTFTNDSLVRTGETMTVQGAVNKTAIALLLAVVSASYTWQLYFSGNAGAVTPWMIAGGLGGFVIGLVTTFKPQWSAVTTPLYAVLEGLFLGALSSTFEARMPGIVIQAVMLTFGTLAALLAAYKTGLIRATATFKRGVIAATGGIALVYLASMVLGFFHIQIPGIFGNGMIGIGFSLFVVILAAMNLVIDFDFIEQGARSGAPKYMEWYAGFGVLVTLVWLYLEILRLLSKLNRRD
jgi:uncharacterized YccA/Bax inhibitor family protein